MMEAFEICFNLIKIRNDSVVEQYRHEWENNIWGNIRFVTAFTALIDAEDIIEIQLAYSWQRKHFL